MPQIKTIDIDPVDVDADGIAESQTPLGAGNLTLDGVLVSGGVYTASDAAHQLVITAVADESARTFTVTGTDSDGSAQTEEIAGPNATTVESAKHFLTVTQIAVDAATLGAVTVGTVDEIATKTIMLNRRQDTGPLVHYDVTGTISLTAQISINDIQKEYVGQDALAWVNTGTATLVTATADALGRLEAGSYGCRFLVNSYSSGAEAQISISEVG